jgi:hypothetical protein
VARSPTGKENAMGINEIDYTIYPYTVGREDCKVLPRSFETLAEAEAYLAEQDKGALERGEFYLDGPEENKAAFDAGHLSMSPKTTVPAPTAAQPAKVDSECSPTPIESRVVRGVWTRDIEALCRALEAQH